MKIRRGVSAKCKIDKLQFFIIPTIGVIDKSRYYGYRTLCIAFAWAWFRYAVTFGVLRLVGEERLRKFVVEHREKHGDEFDETYESV